MKERVCRHLSSMSSIFVSTWMCLSLWLFFVWMRGRHRWNRGRAAVFSSDHYADGGCDGVSVTVLFCSMIFWATRRKLYVVVWLSGWPADTRNRWRQTTIVPAAAAAAAIAGYLACGAHSQLLFAYGRDGNLLLARLLLEPIVRITSSIVESPVSPPAGRLVLSTR